MTMTLTHQLFAVCLVAICSVNPEQLEYHGCERCLFIGCQVADVQGCR